MRKYLPVILISILLLFASCSSKKPADLIVHNAVVYTVDSNFTVTESFAVKDGLIIDAGKNSDILKKYVSDNIIDAQGKPVYPGFIDAHCHFFGYGLNLKRVDLTGCKSFDEAIERTEKFSRENSTPWIVGRGWDQNLWKNKEFPDREKLDKIFPDKPVLLVRVDGHAAVANGEALRRAGFTPVKKIFGGELEIINGRLTGILLDNAIDSIRNYIPEASRELKIQALLDAQKNCFEVGLTTVDDAGLKYEQVSLIRELQKENKLKMRIYAMLEPEEKNFAEYLNKGKYKDNYLNICSFKFYADGALGSRGACLLQPYSDKPGHYGYLIEKIDLYKKYARELYDKDFQMNTHCIGDSANRLVLDIYADVLGGSNERRWRIEHCQVVNINDIEKFRKFSIIPSVQPTHATSDMLWAVARLGQERIQEAYAYKNLLLQNGYVVAGSDFPVEQINPLLGFFAAVARTNLNGIPAGGFQIENALTPEEALKAMTIWAAYSNFEENEKGSIEKGKFADFVILNTDIMKVDINKIPLVKVISTYLNGEKVFSMSN